MKKQLLFLLIVILSMNCYSQIIFEKGYYINNTNQKVNCLIKNIDWKDNPTEIEFKLTENSDTKKATIKTVKEFGIYNIAKYSRYTVKIDKSSSVLSEMSDSKYPIFQEEELFLKVLVEGKASLYSFKDNNLERYFYSTDSSIVEQLVFKEYWKAHDEVGTNNRYKQQLWNDLKCPTFKMFKVENVNYRKSELIRFFVEYNECNNQEFTNFEEKEKRDLFNLSIRPGLKNSSLSMQNSRTNFDDVDFGDQFGIRFGIEAEYIMPFNKNKWAILIEPTYQYFKSEKELAIQNVKIDYKSIELPLGIRHYFFLSDNSKIFLNGSFILDFGRNSSVIYDYGMDMIIRTSTNYAFGLGYKHNDRYSLEFRYQTSRNILADHTFWGSEYKTLSVIFGYSFF